MKPAMKPEDIRALLAKNKAKQIEIVRDLGVTSGAVSRVIDGHFPSRRIQEAIAKKVRVPFEQMWGKAA
jgi:predicted XRE-type DNA-binding protein